MADAEAGGDLGGAAVEVQGGALAGEAANLKLRPVDAAADARAERLGRGLLGGEARGEALGGGLVAGVAVGDLAGGVDAGEEALAEAGDRALDAGDLDEVSAKAEDHETECRG